MLVAQRRSGRDVRGAATGDTASGCNLLEDNLGRPLVGGVPHLQGVGLSSQLLGLVELPVGNESNGLFDEKLAEGCSIAISWLTRLRSSDEPLSLLQEGGDAVGRFAGNGRGRALPACLSQRCASIIELSGGDGQAGLQEPVGLSR